VTVSLALRGDPSIPGNTRKRIENIAKCLGYSPDPLLTALSSYRKQSRPAAYQANIAWIMGSPNAGPVRGEFDLYFDGAQMRAKQFGHMLDQIDLTGMNMNLEWLQRLLKGRNITGLILAPTLPTGTGFNFDFSQDSAVRIGYSYRFPQLHTVANAQFRTILTTMQKVAALGYRRIGCILTEDLDERTSWQFLGGYLAGQHFVAKKDWIPPFYTSPSAHLNDLGPAIYAWIVRHKVGCLTGPGYTQLYNYLVQHGLNIGYADTQVAEGDEFFSGIHQNPRQIGIASIDLLIGMLHRHETGIPEIPSQLLIDGTWRMGQTIKKVGETVASPRVKNASARLH
jgi:hypothetical protein